MGLNSRKENATGDWVGPVVAWLLILMVAAIFLNSVHEARAITCKQLRARRATTCRDPWEAAPPSRPATEADAPPVPPATTQH